MTDEIKDAKKEYWQQGTDTRKLVLRFLGKIWIVIAGIIGGVLAGTVIYFIYHAAADPTEYSAVSEFYLDFAADETGEAYQYYNGYTWNDLMSTDLIAADTLKGLGGTGADVSVIEKDTTAEILSDIRVLRVTIKDEDEEFCGQLQKATEASLEALGGTAKEFNSITTIKSTAPERVYADNRLVQAMELGGIAGLLAVLLVMAFAYILDDRIYVPSDLKGYGIPVLGVRFANKTGKLSEKLEKLCEANEAAVTGTSGEEAYVIDAGTFCSGDMDCSEADGAKGGSAVIIRVPYGKVRGSRLRLLMDALDMRGVEVSGMMITEADEKFYGAYYFAASGEKA